MFNIEFSRSNIDISISVRHGAKLRLISVFGAPNLDPLELRNRCVVCFMPIVISGRLGSPPMACNAIPKVIFFISILISYTSINIVPRPPYGTPAAALKRRSKLL